METERGAQGKNETVRGRGAPAHMVLKLHDSKEIYCARRMAKCTWKWMEIWVYLLARPHVTGQVT